MNEFKYYIIQQRYESHTYHNVLVHNCISIVLARYQCAHYRHIVLILFFFTLLHLPPTSTLFPYTTLFRSASRGPCAAGADRETGGYEGGTLTHHQPDDI